MTMPNPEDQKTPDSQAKRDASAQTLSLDRRSLNLPNLITFSRLVLAVILFVIIDFEGLWITAAVIFVVAAATDALDGYIARRYGLVTTLGRILDPFADKIIICGAFVFLLEEKMDSGVNAWMVIVIIGREMYVTGLRAFLEQHGRDFSAIWSGKVKMTLQSVAVTASLLSLSPDFQSVASDVLQGSVEFNTLRNTLLWTAVAVTAYSGFVYSHRAFRMLRPSSKS